MGDLDDLNLNAARGDDEFSGDMPLDTTARRAMSGYVDRLLAASDMAEEHNCFFCAMVARYEKEKSNAAGQRDFMIEGAYGYKLAIDFHNNNPHLSPVAKAKGINKIYVTHVYAPAQRALGGRKPPDLPEPSDRAILEHLLWYNFDLTSLKMEALNFSRMLMYSFSNFLVVDGRPNHLMARAMDAAIGRFDSISDKLAKLLEGKPGGPFTLDPQKVLAFGDTRPVDAFRQQAREGIGGATATNTTAAMQRMAARRPDFGDLAEEGEGEDIDAMQV